MGWRVLKVEDGENLEALTKAFEKAQKPCGKPTLIDCRTIIGFPAPTKQNTHHAHGAPLGEDEIKATKQILGWDPEAKFVVPAEALAHWRATQERGEVLEAEWKARFEAYAEAHPELAKEFEAFLKGELGPGLGGGCPLLRPDGQAGHPRSQRQGAQRHRGQGAQPHRRQRRPGALQQLRSQGRRRPSARARVGRNFHWGIREHAMGAVLNGMSLHGGLRVFGATFLIFCDYMRPSVRLAAPDEAARHLHLDPRLHRGRRGRPHPPAHRAGDVPAHDPQHDRPAPRGRQRDRGSLALRHAEDGWSGGPGPHPPEAARAGRRQGQGARQGRLHPGGSQRRSEADPAGHGQRSASRRGGPQAARGRGHSHPRRVHAQLGALRRPAPGLPRRGAASRP